MVVWIAGLSGAGKTTLSQALARRLKPRLPQVVLVDGDILRELFGNDLDHSEPSRVIQIRRLQQVALWLARQGQIPIVAALYARDDLLAWNRANLPGYFEIYLRASIDVVEGRDSKAIYARARRGEMPNVVGLDIPWNEPAGPDLVLDSNGSATPEELANQVVATVPVFAAAARILVDG